MRLTLSLLAVGCLAPVTFASTVFGTNGYSVNFSSTDSGVTFTAVAPLGEAVGNSSATSLIPSGSVTVNTLSAVGTDFAAGNISANVMGDITTGFGGSFSGGLPNGNIAEAYSGVVRVTNTTGSKSSYSLQDTNTWALSVSGTENAAIALAAQLQYWNGVTWAAFSSLSLGISQGDAPVSVCQAGCGPFNNNPEIQANSSLYYRVYVKLYAFSEENTTPDSQVPEPSSLALGGAAGLALLASKFARSK